MEIEKLSPEEEKQLAGEETPATPDEKPSEGEQAQAEKGPEADKPPEAEGKAEKDKPPKGYVEHGAFHEERKRRKETEQRLAELQEKWVRLDERVRASTEKPQAIPNPEEDPIGYQHYQQQELRQNLEKTTRNLDERFQQQANELQALRLRAFIDSQERAFSSKTPDYQQALEFFAKTRGEMLEEMGMEHEERNAVVQQELQHFVTQALRAQRNPAESVYNMAKRMGYKQSSKDPGEKLDTLQKGLDTAKSLGQAGGHGSKELTAEAAAELTDEDFNKISDKDFRRMFGG
jgi:hypothetical protein